MTLYARERALLTPHEVQGPMLPRPLGADSIMERGRAECVPECVLLLTLLLLAFYGGSGWQLSIPLKVACCAGVVIPRIRRSALFWTAITGLVAFINGLNWHVIDNHKYLITYWSLCITLAMSWPRMSLWILGKNAHGLIGSCFALAVLWKIIAGQYLDGSFLHHTMLTDPRVQVVAALVGDIPLSDLALNRRMYSHLTSWPFEYPSVVFASSPRLETAALVLSYWTLLIESIVALLWLLPVGRASLFKHGVLMVFILTTYVILPVVGFATILGVMGYAASVIEGRRRLSMVWLTVIGAAQCASIPWTGILAGYIR